MTKEKAPIAHRFRGYLPVVVDVETGGFNPKTDALLEFAAIIIDMQDNGLLIPGEQIFYNIEPFVGANIEQASLEFTGIDPTNPLRGEVTETEALNASLSYIRKMLKATGCHRAIMVAHNAAFDLSFLMEAAERVKIKRNPFHPFSSFDTATLCGMAYGQTVLAKACELAKISFNSNEAHSAIYDCEKTAAMFCHIVNRWQQLGGWLPPIHTA